MNENWYTPAPRKNEADWYAPAPRTAPPEAKKKPSKKIRWGRILGLCCIAAVCFGGGVFAWLQWNRSEPVPSAAAPSPSADTEASDYPKDYRDLMKQYYTVSYSAAEECTIPRFTAPEGTVLPLEESNGVELTRQKLYEKCASSVVGIRAYEDKTSGSYGWGSGVLFSSDGYIVTNSHIIEGCSSATVILWNDEEYEASFVGNDSRTDMAVLKIDATELPYAEFSHTVCTVGDSVVAIGNPLGETFRSSMTEGIISGIDRNMSYNGATLPMLQTTAPINSGNSGGALFNMQGQVVGITNMKMVSSYSGSATIEGVCFAIPTHTVKSSVDGILKNGEVTGRPALGMTMGAIPEVIRTYYDLPDGLYVSGISHGSGFENSGIEEGDIVTAFNGVETHTTSDIISMLENVGDIVELEVYHRNKDGTVSVFTVSGPLVDVNDVY